VVGCTKADEGEYIGDTGTAHLRGLLPPTDDPDLAAAFQARLATDPGPELPTAALEGRATGGFSTGGDRRSLRLHPEDEALIAGVVAANPRTIVAIVAGSAVIMEPWRPQVPAIVQAWYSGMEGGHALADVLLGHVDATGRLPFSVPTDEAHLPPFDIDADAVAYDAWHGYWRLARDRHEPAHPFGFGLSYTSWDLGAATLDEDGPHLVVRATLTNTGSRDGADVVQVYGGRPADPIRPAMRLVGFTRVEVPAGQSRTVELRIPTVHLQVRDAGRWMLPTGTYVLRVARHSADRAACDVVWDH